MSIKKEIEKEKEEKVIENEEELEEEGEEEEKKEDLEAVEAAEEKAINRVAERISKKLGIDDIKKQLTAKVGYDSPILKELFGGSDLNKDLKSLTKEEKIVSFFKALVTNDKVALKALSEGTPADGGYLVPDEFMAELVRDLVNPTRMRALVRVVPMTRDVMNIPRLGSKPKVYWTAENATKTTTTADFDQKVLTVYKVAAILYASEELVEDSSDFNIVQLIIGLFSEAIGEEEDRVIIQGSGVGQPTGLTTCTIGEINCTGNLDFDDLINLIYLLPAKYRKNATLLVSNHNIRELRKIKDLDGQYIWSPAIAPGQPETILGYPIVESEWIPGDEIYFGDLRLTYWLGDRRRITVTVSTEAGEAWEHDQVGIRVVERIAGNCVLEAAMRRLVSIP